jgi:F0F1-type ATP synthase assembly protein I
MKLKLTGSGTWFQLAMKYGTVGLEMGICTFLGILIGSYLDRHFHTTPWMTLLFTFFGLVAAFKSLFTLARRVIREEENQQNKNNDDSQQK